MTDRPADGGASGSEGASGNGDGAGDPERADPASRTGPVERLRDAIAPRKLTSSIATNTGTIIVTAVAGIIVAEFGHGWVPGLLTFVVAVAAGAIAGLVTFYLPDQKRGPRSSSQPAPEQNNPGDGEIARQARGRRLLRRAWATVAVLAGLTVLAVVSFGVVRAFARAVLPGTLSLLVAVIVIVGVPMLWQRRHSWPAWLLRLRPGPLLRPLSHKSSGTEQPEHARAWITYPRARVVMACVLATAAVMSGTELGLSVHTAACPGPAELRILASPEDLSAIQAAIPIFEQNEPEYVGSACFAVQLTAYAPEDAPSETELATDFESGWNSGALSEIGPEPDIWIPDSTAEIAAVESAMFSGPAFDQSGPIGYSPLVVAVPEQLFSSDSLGAVEHGKSWSTLYTDFSGLGIKLALPSPDVSEVGLLEITALYGDGTFTAAAERQVEASGNFPEDSQDLLCEASQAGQSIDTAYLVSEAAMADYNHSNVDPTEDQCPTPGKVLPMQALYPASTATLNFPFTTVNWESNQSAPRRRYENDFFNFLTKSTGGISALESQGLRRPDCGMGGTINQANGVAAVDSSCEEPQQPPSTAATQAELKAFTSAVPHASVLIGIDDSQPMKPDLAQITSAIDTVLDPVNASLSPVNASPLGIGDHFGIWELPGDGGLTDTPLANFGPVTNASLQHVDSQLAGVAAHQHSADYDMLTDAAKVLYGQQRVLPGGGIPPINSVVLITDGDGYSGHDPGGGTAATVRATFTGPPFGESSIALYIIAFGPAGCTSTMLGLTEATHGSCYPADGGDPRQLLGQALDQITGGG